MERYKNKTLLHVYHYYPNISAHRERKSTKINRTEHLLQQQNWKSSKYEAGMLQGWVRKPHSIESSEFLLNACYISNIFSLT
jgi:hypothetical protein